VTIHFGGISSWNPLRCSGASMPPGLLLMAKMIALALLLTGSVPDNLGLRILQVVLIAVLLCNRAVRVMTLALSCTLLAQAEYLPALFLFFAACHTRDSHPLALQWLLAVIYLVAGASGAFQHYWLPSELGWPAHGVLWGPLIVLSLTAAATLFLPHLNHIGIPAALAVSGLPVVLAGAAPNLLIYTLPAALFAYLPWPRDPLLVLYDGDCGFCDWSREWLSRFDFDGRFAWVPYQSGAGHAFGIPDERAQERLQLITPVGDILEGFHAIRRMLYYLPVLWMALVPATALLPGPLRRLLLGAVLVVLSPLINPLGRAAYDWVARNRHRLFPGRACALPTRPNGPDTSL